MTKTSVPDSQLEKMSDYYADCANETRSFANGQSLKLKEVLCTSSLAFITIFAAVVNNEFMLKVPCFFRTTIFYGVIAFVISIIFGCVGIGLDISFLNKVSKIHGEISNLITKNDIPGANKYVQELQKPENLKSDLWPMMVQIISFAFGLIAVVIYLFFVILAF